MGYSNKELLSDLSLIFHSDDLTGWKVRTYQGLEGWVVDFVDSEQILLPVG